MENGSYFYYNKAIFGHYPSQDEIDDLEKMGVIWFVNLTYSDERLIKPYKTTYNYINFPIKDNDIPLNIVNYTKFLIRLSKIIKSIKGNEKIYIHCKAGHGRCGIVVSCLLYLLLKNINSFQALEMTNNYHNKRINMRERWRRIGSPQTRGQKMFVKNYLYPLYINDNSKYNLYSDFLLDNDKYSIDIPNLGRFNNCRGAYEVFKNLADKEYIKKQKISLSSSISRLLGNKKIIYNKGKWEKNKSKILYKILKIKFDNNLELKKRLINTGIRPLKISLRRLKCKYLINDIKLTLKILTRIRYEYYDKMILEKKNIKEDEDEKWVIKKGKNRFNSFLNI